MSKQIGIVHLSGQFGDLRMVISGKRSMAMLAPGVPKERFKTGDEFLNMRKVNVEFQAASLAVDTMRSCLCGKSSTFGDRYLRARLQAVLIAAVRRGPGLFGQRSLEVVQNVLKLKEFPLNKHDRFRNWFFPRLDVQVNPDRNTATLVVPPFLINPGTLRVPQGATNFRVFLCVGALSDFEYSSSDAQYEALNPDLNGLHEEMSTGWLPVQGQNPGFQLVAALPGLPVLPATAGLVVSLGVEFCFMVNSNPEITAGGNAMDVLDVF